MAVTNQQGANGGPRVSVKFFQTGKAATPSNIPEGTTVAQFRQIQGLAANVPLEVNEAPCTEDQVLKEGDLVFAKQNIAGGAR